MSDTPRKLGRYELVRRIAKGGMGEIYLARTEGTAGFEKTVIIKTILPHLAEEEEFVEKFLDEGRIVVNLTHGNIVPVFDMDEADGEYFIAMEYVPGRDLREILKRLRERGERMAPDLAAYIISEVCEGLGYAHDKTDDSGEPLQIVHRDVSPSNVLISTDGEAKIIDFGVARAADKRAKTVSGRIQGKCCYMSPEQAKGKSLDRRSDIFSTGTVLYELLTNVRPFEGDSDLKSLDLVRECEYDPPSVLEPMVPEELDAVVGRALERDREERYQSIDDMKLDLKQYLVSRGRAVTSEEVADFLADLFPEGLERDEFKEAREEADEPSGPMGLDEALEYQLDQEADAKVSPLEETLPDDGLEEISSGGRTETITPEAGSEGPTAEETPRGGTGETEDAETTPETDDGSSKGGDADTEPATETLADRDDESDYSGWATVGVAAFVAAAAVVYLISGEGTARLTVESEPDEARVRIAGTEIDGEETPVETRLPAGEYDVRIRKDGYKPRRRTVQLDSGTTRTIEMVLEERRSRESRTFIVETEPPGGTLRIDRKRRGEAPKPVEVAPGETKFVAADKPGCRGDRTSLSYDRDDDVVEMDLACGESADGDAGEQEGAEESASRDRPVRAAGPDRPEARAEQLAVQFESTPEGAVVRVDGERIGRTPVRKRFARERTLEVRFEKSGRESVERTVAVDGSGGVVRAELGERQTGCLDFLAVHPQFNEIAIDGDWLDGRRQNLQDYELTAGTHTIRVRNPDANKDETFTFEVEPGEDCTSLTVWDR